MGARNDARTTKFGKGFGNWKGGPSVVLDRRRFPNRSIQRKLKTETLEKGLETEKAGRSVGRLFGPAAVAPNFNFRPAV